MKSGLAPSAFGLLILLAGCTALTGEMDPDVVAQSNAEASVSIEGGHRPRSLASAVNRGDIKGKERSPPNATVTLLPHERMPSVPGRPAARSRAEAIARTLEDLTSPSPHRRFIATKDAGTLRLRDAVPDLARLLRKGEPTAAPAIGSLGKIGGDEAARTLLRAYRKLGDPSLDLYVLHALGQTRSRVALKALVSALRDDRIRFRIAAARALGALGVVDAAQHLRRVLQRAESPPALRVAAASSLAALGSDECIPELERAVATAGPELQRAAIIGLASFVASPTLPGMPSSPGRRGRAVRIIASAIGSRYPLAWRASLQALAGMKPLDAIPVIEALQRGSDEIALRARLAKAAFGGEDARESIRASLASADMQLRAAACDVAGRLADSSLVPDVAHALGDGISIVRVAAVDALAEIGGEAAVRELYAASQGEDPELRATCQDALERLRAAGRMPVGMPRGSGASDEIAPVGEDVPIALERVVAGAGGEPFCVLRDADGTIELLKEGETTASGYRVALIASNVDNEARVVVTKDGRTLTLGIAKRPAAKE